MLLLNFDNDDAHGMNNIDVYVAIFSLLSLFMHRLYKS